MGERDEIVPMKKEANKQNHTAVYIQNNQIHQQEKSKWEASSEQIEMLRLENQRLHELERLRLEHDLLEKLSKESEELCHLRKENERLKKLSAKNNKAKKGLGPSKYQSDTKLYAVKIPKGIRPGETFKVRVNETQYSVTCPPNTRCGQIIHVPIK